MKKELMQEEPSILDLAVSSIEINQQQELFFSYGLPIILATFKNNIVLEQHLFPSFPRAFLRKGMFNFPTPCLRDVWWKELCKFVDDLVDRPTFDRLIAFTIDELIAECDKLNAESPEYKNRRCVITKIATDNPFAFAKTLFDCFPEMSRYCKFEKRVPMTTLEAMEITNDRLQWEIDQAVYKQKN